MSVDRAKLLEALSDGSRPVAHADIADAVNDASEAELEVAFSEDGADAHDAAGYVAIVKAATEVALGSIPVSSAAEEFLRGEFERWGGKA